MFYEEIIFNLNYEIRIGVNCRVEPAENQVSLLYLVFSYDFLLSDLDHWINVVSSVAS